MESYRGGVSPSAVSREASAHGRSRATNGAASAFCAGVKPTLLGFAAFALAAAAVNADAATWKGGASGDIANADNWDGDVTTSAMTFTGDAALSLSQDMTVHDAFSGAANAGSAFDSRTVTFDLRDGNGGPHVLCSTNRNNNGAIYWRAGGTTYRLVGGTLALASAAGTTNTVFLDDSNPYQYRMTLSVEDGATFAGNMFVHSATGPHTQRVAVKNGGAFVGSLKLARAGDLTLSGEGSLLDTLDSGAFNLGGFQSYTYAASTNMTAVVSDGAVLRTGAGTSYANTTSVGNGASASNNVLRVENGGRLEARTDGRPLVIGHSGSCSNMVEIVGAGSSFTNMLTAAYPLGNSDWPLCIGLNSSRNALVFDGSEGWLGAVGVGSPYKAPNTTKPYENLENRLVAKNGARLRVGYLSVGNSHWDQKVPAQAAGKRLEGNVVEILSGSALTVAGTTCVGGHPKASGNRMTVSGEGTKFTFGAVTEEMAKTINANAHISVGACGSNSNRLEVLDGAELVRGTVIESGKTTTKNGAYFIYVGSESNDRGSNSEDGTEIRYGGCGNVLAFENAVYTNNVTSYEVVSVGAQQNGNGNAVFVGTGATVKFGQVHMNGFDNRLVVSNGTLSVINQVRFVHNDANGNEIAGRHVVRIEGANAILNPSRVDARNGSKDTLYTFSGTEILEFAVPEAGWSAAPFAIGSKVTLPAGTKVKVDEKSAKAYARANGSGTVPLLRSTSSITVADMAALSSELPSNVSLVLSSDNKTLSCKIDGQAGTTIVIR